MIKIIAVLIGCILGHAVFAQTLTPTGGGSGGITSLTANSSPTSGFSAGQFMFSDGSKLQNSTNVTFNSGTGTLTASATSLVLGAATGTVYDYNVSATGQHTFTGSVTLGTGAFMINASSGSSIQHGSFPIQFGSSGVTSPDTGIARNAAGVTEANNATKGTLAEFKSRSYVGGGSSPTNSGTCAVTSQTGGNTVGSFIASGACAAGTYIFGFGFSAPNGWACDAEDRTTITDTIQQTASTVTNATFKATTASADVVSWKCTAY